MTRIVLDQTALGKLEGLTQPAELCTPGGRVIGRYYPEVDLSEWEPVSAEVSEDELDRRARSKEKRYSTEEVIRHLENL